MCVKPWPQLPQLARNLLPPAPLVYRQAIVQTLPNNSGAHRLHNPLQEQRALCWLAQLKDPTLLHVGRGGA